VMLLNVIVEHPHLYAVVGLAARDDEGHGGKRRRLQ
jgi:hypothetical protein